MNDSKTLQELEEKDWGEPDEAPTNMVRRCLVLRRVPLNQLSAEDCRLLLGQKIGAAFIVPIALRFLGENPMEGGDFLPGNLLQNVLRQPETFWQDHQSLWWEVKGILFEVKTLREQLELLAPLMEQFGMIDVG